MLRNDGRRKRCGNRAIAGATVLPFLRTAPPHLSSGEWRTLREASELTGIPIGTLRKWCRRETVKSYLESDGELTLRMVEMGSVRAQRRSHESPDAGRESRA